MNYRGVNRSEGWTRAPSPLLAPITERILALDGIRAVSVLLVILSHIEMNSSLHLGLAAYGRLGVEVFFGISGFVIGRGLFAQHHSSPLASLSWFYVRRFLRIVPPLLAYVLIIFVLARIGLIEAQASGITRALTFTCNLSEPMACGGWFGGHMWSLSIEEQFYLAFPPLLLLFARRPRVFSWALYLVVAALTLALFAVQHTPVAITLSHFGTITAGILCAAYEKELRARVANMSGWILLLSLPTLILVWNIWPTPATTSLRTLLMPIAVAACLMAACFKDSPVRDLLSSRPLVIVGGASYSIYLWQQLATAPLGARGWVHPALIVACVLMVVASNLCVERPLIALGRRLGGRP